MTSVVRDDPRFLFDTAKEFHGSIHGDIIRHDGSREVDIEFPTVADASDFSQSIRKYVTSVDIRTGDSVSSLTQSVVLTVITIGE
jgi:hypothetical protein